MRETRRRYEENHREERKEKNKVLGTSINREFAEEIDMFLSANKITKVDLIVAGYIALQQQVKGSENK